MRLHVLGKVVTAAKSLGAPTAFVRPLLGMRSYVSLEMLESFEEPAAGYEGTVKTFVDSAGCDGGHID